MTPARKREEEIARSWVTLQRNWWSYEVIQDACEKHPLRAWRILVRLSSVIDSADLISVYGAGPLEDFVRAHAPQFIDELEALASRNPIFRRAIRLVWLPRAVDDTSKRLFALGCKPLEVSIAPWQTAPPKPRVASKRPARRSTPLRRSARVKPLDR